MSDETPKLRLKPKLVADASVAAPVPAAPAAAPISLIAPPPPPPPIAPPPPMPLAPVATAAPPVLAKPVIAPIPAPVAAVRPPRSSKNIHRAAIGIGMAGIFIFSSAGYIAYRNLGESDEEPEEQVDDVADKRLAEGTVAATPMIAAEPPHRPSPDSTAAPEAGNAAPAEAVVDATARQWVNTVKISGTRSGRSPKVLIGGKTYNVGDTVHAELGIMFDDYDAGRHLVRFKDRSGARYERRIR